MAALRRITGSAALVAVLASSCRNDSTSGVTRTGSSAGDLGASAAVPVAQPAPAPAFDEAAFHLAIRPVGEYTALTPGFAEIVLSPKDGYHCNEKYPYKLKVVPSPAIKYDAEVIGADQVRLEPARAVLRLGFTPQRPGQLAVGGTLAFSVCSEDRCLIEKRPLALALTVK